MGMRGGAQRRIAQIPRGRFDSKRILIVTPVIARRDARRVKIAVGVERRAEERVRDDREITRSLSSHQAEAHESSGVIIWDAPATISRPDYARRACITTSSSNPLFPS